MKKLLCGVLLVSTLSGCADGTPKPDGTRDIPGNLVLQSDGKPAYVVTCDNYSSYTACLNRSAKICRDIGYTTLQSHDEEWHFFEPIFSVHRYMVIRCNTPNGLYPGDEKLPFEDKPTD